MIIENNDSHDYNILLSKITKKNRPDNNNYNISTDNNRKIKNTFYGVLLKHHHYHHRDINEKKKINNGMNKSVLRVTFKFVIRKMN